MTQSCEPRRSPLGTARDDIRMQAALCATRLHGQNAPPLTPRQCGQFQHLGPAEFLDHGHWNLAPAALNRQVVIGSQLAMGNFSATFAAKLLDPSPLLVSVPLATPYLGNWSQEKVFAPGRRQNAAPTPESVAQATQ